MDDRLIDLKKLGATIRFLRQGKNWALADLAEKSAVSKPESEDLASFAGALASALPEARALAGELKTLAAAVTLEDAPGEPDISALFSRVDKWIVSAADLCQRRDPTLVLRDALPGTVSAPRLLAAVPA